MCIDEVAVNGAWSSSYGPYASSALAAQSLFRMFTSMHSAITGLNSPSLRDSYIGNLTGMAFPLFIQQMLKALTLKWANTLFACIGVVLLPIPYVRSVLSARRVTYPYSISIG